VVVTGAGVITALGQGWPANAAGFRSGRTAFRPVTLFPTDGQRAKRAAEVDLPADLPPTCLRDATKRRLNRGSRLLLNAAAEAWRQSRWEPGHDLPVVLGTTSCGMDSGESWYEQTVAAEGASRQGQPTRTVAYQGQHQAVELLEALGCTGPVTLIANACASGANAIGHAWELVRTGVEPRVLTGGFDALSRLVFAGFDSLQALSTTTCRPFDASRDGLALGEGAAVLTVESLEHAQRRGAPILAEIIGYGAATDSHHLTQPQPEGRAALAAMQTACDVAGISPQEVDYINAHGTGTPHNDSSEARAIATWAGPRVAALPVSSVKGGIGHLLGAAGAVEAVLSLMVLREGWLPPQPMVEEVDSVCAFPLVREPCDSPVQVVLSNSFGFGGANATLAFRRWAGA
jgi:3-oxoacyl-[acyl-carrier-protein] synthase II